VFDSGIGGLSILNEALMQAPLHQYLYLADSANTPYGEKSTDWVANRSLELCSWLVDQGSDAIIVACNTATAEAIAHIRERYPMIPIVGVEPGIKPAAINSQQKIVGVLATQNTLNSDKFKLLLKSLNADCQFIQQAGNGLVPLIEQGILDGPDIRKLLHEYIDPMLAQGADTLVLGCTHYPFLQDAIKNLYGNQLQIIDTSEAVVRQFRRLMHKSSSEQTGSVSVYSTQNGETLLELAQKLCIHPFLTVAKASTVFI
jgi:glutamate racemase